MRACVRAYIDLFSNWEYNWHDCRLRRRRLAPESLTVGLYLRLLQRESAVACSPRTASLRMRFTRINSDRSRVGEEPGWGAAERR